MTGGLLKKAPQNEDDGDLVVRKWHVLEWSPLLFPRVLKMNMRLGWWFQMPVYQCAELSGNVLRHQNMIHLY